MKIKKILSILIALTFTSIALPSISFADALCNDGTISKAVKGDKAACANNGGVKQWDDGTQVQLELLFLLSLQISPLKELL
jgi:hypothetical protein